MAIFIEVVAANGRPPEIPQRVEFAEAGGSIGRADDNNLRLGDPQRHISRYHARVTHRLNRYFILDTGSSTPVILNSVPIGNGREAEIRPGDELRIGHYLLHVKAPVDAGLARDALTTGAPSMPGASAGTSLSDAPTVMATPLPASPSRAPSQEIADESTVMVPRTPARPAPPRPAAATMPYPVFLTSTAGAPAADAAKEGDAPAVAHTSDALASATDSAAFTPEIDPRNVVAAMKGEAELAPLAWPGTESSDSVDMDVGGNAAAGPNVAVARHTTAVNEVVSTGTEMRVAVGGSEIASPADEAAPAAQGTAAGGGRSQSRFERFKPPVGPILDSSGESFVDIGTVTEVVSEATGEPVERRPVSVMRALCEGAGIGSATVGNALTEQQAYALGAMARAVVFGLRDVLADESLQAGSNPIAEAASIEEAVSYLLGMGGRAHPDPVTAVHDAFERIASAQRALPDAVRDAFRAALARFKPHNVMARVADGRALTDSLFLGGNRAKLWVAYEESYEQNLKEVESDFRKALQVELERSRAQAEGSRLIPSDRRK
jgi:FHA domain-containing protein